MEYPGTTITKPIRSALFIICVAVFLVLSPALIMYTAGYRYDWRNGFLKETGAISIDVLPADTTAYLSGVLIKQSVPIRLKNITPGKYQIRLTASGYYDWIKDVEIKSKQTVYIKEINLIKKEKPELLQEGVVTATALSPDNRYLIYTLKHDAFTEIWLRDNVAGTKNIITQLDNAADINFYPAPKNNFFGISVGNAPYKKLLLVDINNPTQPLDLARTAKDTITKFIWRDTNGGEIFYSTAENIFSFNITTQTNAVVTANKYLDWWLDAGQLWTLQINTSTKGIDIYKDTLGFASKFATINDGAQYQIANAKNNTVLLKNIGAQQMELITADHQFPFAGGQNLISNFNDWWLFWTPWELTTYSAGEEPYLLNRSGEDLRTVVPLDRYNTLALVWKNKVTILFPYYLVNHDLITGEINSATADTADKILYCSGKIGKQEGLWQLKY